MSQIFFRKPPVRNPPAFIPQTPFCGQENSAEVLPNPFPQKIVLAKPSPHCSATCQNSWRAEPRKKNTLSFFKRNFTPAKSEMQGVFFLSGFPPSLRGGGETIHSRSKKVQANDIMTPHKAIHNTLVLWVLPL